MPTHLHLVDQLPQERASGGGEDEGQGPWAQSAAERHAGTALPHQVLQALVQ